MLIAHLTLAFLSFLFCNVFFFNRNKYIFQSYSEQCGLQYKILIINKNLKKMFTSRDWQLPYEAEETMCSIANFFYF